MDREELRLECLKMAVEHGAALEVAPSAAQRLFQFILGHDELSVSFDGLEAFAERIQ